MYYERFKDVIERIPKYYSQMEPDLIICQIRSQQYIRLVPMVNTYADEQKKLKLTINLPYLKEYKNETYRPEAIYEIYENITEFGKNDNNIGKSAKLTEKVLDLFYNQKTRIKINELNFKTGIAFGNRRMAIKLYFKLIDEIIEFAQINKKKIIFLGIYPRPISIIENVISKDINDKFIKYFENKPYMYVNYFDEFDKNWNKYYQGDLVHLNKDAHIYIADVFYKQLSRLIGL